MFIVYAKLGTALLLTLVLLVVLYQRRWVENRLDTSGWAGLSLFWAGLRLLPFVGVYVMLDYRPHSDVSEYYYPISLTALTGGVPYRDVYSGYSPLFGYWLAPFLAIWREPRSIVLAMLLVEGLAVWLTYRYYHTDESRGKRLFRCLFYYLLPVPFVLCVLSGQEDVILWLFALLAIPFMPSGRAAGAVDTSGVDRSGNASPNDGAYAGQPFVAGLILGLGMLATKAVFVLVLIPVWLLTTRDWRFTVRFTAGLLTVGLPVALIMYWKTGLLFLQQQSSEGDVLKAPNWRSVLNPLLTEAGRSAGFIWKWGSLLITLLAMLWGVWLVRTRRRNWSYREYIPLFFVAVYGVMTVVQQNAISNYAYLFMLPLAFTMVDFRRITQCICLIGFNVLAAVHPSLWWRLGRPYYDRIAALLKPVALLEYTIEVLLLVGFIYYAVRAISTLRGSSLSA